MQREDNTGLPPHVTGGLPSPSPLADNSIYLDQIGYPTNHSQKPQFVGQGQIFLETRDRTEGLKVLVIRSTDGPGRDLTKPHQSGPLPKEQHFQLIHSFQGRAVVFGQTQKYGTEVFVVLNCSEQKVLAMAMKPKAFLLCGLTFR